MTYVVQAEEVCAVLAADPSADETYWRDIATVTVPGRVKRRTVVAKALAEADVRPEEGKPLRLRVLDARAAHVTTVSLRVIEPQLEMK